MNTKPEIDPAVLEAFLAKHPEAAKEMEAITTRRAEVQERAAAMLAELNDDEELGAEFERQAGGGEVTDVPAPKARQPRQPRQPAQPKVPKVKAAKQPAAGGVGRPSRASLATLSDEDLEAKIVFARTNNKPWLLATCTEIKKERKHGAQPAKVAPKAPAAPKLVALEKPKGWQGKAGGEPKSIGEATKRRSEAKAAGKETMVEKLTAWIEAHKRTTVNRAEGARKTAGAFGRAFAGRSGGGATASPQQSAQG